MAKKKPVEMKEPKADLVQLQQECAASEHELNEINQEIYSLTKDLFIRKQELAAKIGSYHEEIARFESREKSK